MLFRSFIDIEEFLQWFERPEKTTKNYEAIERSLERSASSSSSPSIEREKLIRRKLRASAYTAGGVDWRKLFKYFDRDNSGMLECEEFRRAIRKDGKMSPSMLSNEDIKFLFDRVDNDQSGYIDINEFVEWVEQSKGQPEEGFTSSLSSSFSSSPSGGRRQSMSSGYGQNGPTALQVPRGSGGKRGSSEKKKQKKKPIWSAHVRRMSTFEHSPILARFQHFL